jgi:hypothetical protein
MKKLLFNMIQPFIRSPRRSGNRADSRGGRQSTFALGTLALICFGLVTTTYARTDLLQPFAAGEDLGNGNSAAENVEALINLSSGVNNTATGFQSLLNNTAGSKNTATGSQSLLNNTSGINNTANGAFSLLSNTTGWRNTATGARALQSNADGVENTAAGESALRDNTSGSDNTATGASALQSNTTGAYNTANGFQALLSNTTGTDNTATGTSALGSNTTGNVNTANGFEALGYNTTGSEHTGIGHHALFSNTTGDQNTAVGSQALVANTTGSGNTANGVNTLYSNTIGGENTAVGTWALFRNGGSSSDNVALGFNAGSQLNNGSHNIYIGAGITGSSSENNACYIASIFGQTAISGVPVLISANNKLGTTTSSRRFKEDIKPMGDASEALLALKPVTFRYKKEIDPQGIPQFGLIAEEVEKVNPDLVVRDREGKVNTVRYEQINAMLLNEFLKEHKKVEEQQTTITQLKTDAAQQGQMISALMTQMSVLTAQVKDQGRQIQRVGVTNRPVPRLVTNR